MRRAVSLAMSLGLVMGLAQLTRAQDYDQNPPSGSVRLPAGNLCPKCVAKMQKRVTADPRDVTMAQMNAGAYSACATCDANGVAYVGQGPNAPGYAMVGSNDPAPIGVMQASRSNAPPYAAGAPGQAQVGPVAPAPMGHTMSYPGYDRGHLLGNIIGFPHFGGWSEARNEKRRQQHAAIRYDEGMSRVSYLPASMVYGR